MFYTLLGYIRTAADEIKDDVPFRQKLVGFEITLASGPRLRGQPQREKIKMIKQNLCSRHFGFQFYCFLM